MYDAVVSSHLNPTLSGVARFNQLLAARFGAPCLGFVEATGLPLRRALLSVKLKDMADGEEQAIRRFLAAAATGYDLFLHTFDELALEYDLVAGARRVLCANAEIRHALSGFDKPMDVLWCPQLVDVSARLVERPFNVFSFGMAHKLQLGYYRRLHAALEESGLDYGLWISTAFHEKSSFGDFSEISGQLSGVFGGRIQFLGFLSDEAINHFLGRAALFAAFFPKGVRANNTSVYVPVLRGCPVLTNLDEHSPDWMRHGENVLDINRLAAGGLAPERLAAVGARARADGAAYASWDALLARLAGGDKENGGTA